MQYFYFEIMELKVIFEKFEFFKLLIVLSIISKK